MPALSVPTIKPKALAPGDTIRIVSPASSLEPASLEFMTELLEKEGYRVTHGRHVFNKNFYLAGTDEERAEDLMAAFLDPEVSAVLCSRGGYGCARILNLLNLDAIVESQKMLLGFSDVTTLHLALNRRGLVTFHSPMAITLSRPREEWVYESFRSVLKGGNPIPETAPKGNCLTPGRATGKTIGGCLCLLTDSIATPEALDPSGKILIIEDVDENPHRVDAMFTHLLNAGILQRSAGIVIGEMTRTDDQSDPTIGPRPWTEIIADRVGNLGIPTITHFPFGHMAQMLSLPLGIEAELDATAGTLTYLESSCR